MTLITALLTQQLITFVLVLARTGALVLTAPMTGQSGVPPQVRGLLAVMLAALITPMQFGASQPAPANLVELAVLVANEMLVGLLLGVGVRLLLTAVQLTGQFISQLSGMSLADVFSPGFDADVPIFANFLLFLTMAVMLCLGGHRMVVEAMLDTFVVMPPGHAALGTDFVSVLSTILTQSLELGIRAGAPVMAALLLSTLILGLVTRTLPQINIIAVGFSLNALLTLAALFLTIGTIAWTLQEQSAETMRMIVDVIGH
jgi:flagellar biosynthetic protein FliR